MKNLITIIALFLSSILYAQNFTESNLYKLSDYSKVLNTTKIDYNKTFTIYLTKDGEPLAKLLTPSKNKLDVFLDTKVELLENPNLENIKQVVKVTFEFLDSCISYETQYFLVTNENILIKLPNLDYRQCEYETEKVAYIFPNQEFGKENNIIQSLSFLDKNGNTESIEVEKTIVWEEENNPELYSYNK